MTDAHSGFRVFSRAAWDELDCSTTGIEFASEIIMEAGAKGLTITEVPITYHEREGEAALDSFRDGWRQVKFMLVDAPGYLFAILAIVMRVVGFGVMGLAFSGVRVGRLHLGIHLMTAASLLAISGYQVGCLGVFASVVSVPIKEGSHPSWVRC